MSTRPLVRLAFLGAVLLGMSTTIAVAQHHSTDREIHVFVGPSMTRYVGDRDAQPGARSGVANNLSFYYQAARRLGVGASLSGNWNVAGLGEGETLAVLRLGLRSYLRESGGSPFVGLSGLLMLGGPETGKGAGMSLGYRFPIGKYVAVSPIVRVDAVTPDRASDGLASGSRFDFLGNAGIELSLAIPLQRPPVGAPPRLDPLADAGQLETEEAETPVALEESHVSEFAAAAILRVKVDSIYGGRQLVVGQEENYRARLKSDAAWPVAYEWDMGDGIRAMGNNIVHFYESPGHYLVKVIARNQYGADSTWTIVNVAPDYESEKTRVVQGATTTEIQQASVARATNNRVDPQESESRQYFAWVIESHTDRPSAEAAVRRYVGRGLRNLRVYRDQSGSGSDAYRVVVGSYDSTRLALAEKSLVESKSQRPPWLITIER